MAEETEQVTLDDLPPIGWLDPQEHGQSITGFQMCTRCSGVVYSDDRGEALAGHERWHAAIENLTVTQTDQPAPRVDESDRCLHVAQALDREFRRQWNAGRCTVADQTEWRSMARAAMDVLDNAEVEACRVALVTALGHPAEDTTFEQAVELVETLIEDRRYCRASHAGYSQGEVFRLRRVEDALVKAGAPNRSERGDPGGLVVRWIERQVALMAELREENKAAGRAVEALSQRPTRDAYNHVMQQAELLERKRQDCEELHTPATLPPSSTVTTVDMRLDLPDDWDRQIRMCHNIGAVVELVRGWATHVCEANCGRAHADEVEACPSRYREDGDLFECKYSVGHPPEWRHKSPEGALWDDAMAEVEQPAEAEVCPSLYLHNDTLVSCKTTWEHDRHQNTPTGNGDVAWFDNQAVPSPWPLDQEPPAGINTLVDTGTPADRCQYLRRHPAGWYWSSALGELNMTRSWAEVTVSVEGDLMVVRP
jgi:hypothetical protein